MQTTQALDFDTVGRVLARAAAQADAADSHGYLCGLVCAAGYAQPGQWETELLGEQAGGTESHAEHAQRLLQAMYQDVQVRLNSPELEFQLLLPDDGVPLVERTEMLGDWCSGFLSGLGVGGLPPLDQLSADSRELLDDLAQISRVAFDIDEPGEEDESAFMEIVEFVRVGVLYLNEELQPRTPVSPGQLQ